MSTRYDEDEYIIEVNNRHGSGHWVRKTPKPLPHDRAWKEYNKIDDKAKRIIQVQYSLISEDKP